MKHLALAVLMLVASVVGAQEKKAEGAKAEPKAKATMLHGYIVDQMCAKNMAKKSNPMELAAKHTKECALEEACAASGYGIFYGDGKWVKFDEKGDKLAKEMFEKSKKEKDFMADVSGELKGDKFVVASLVESKMSTEEMKAPAKKEETHDHKH
ncbi:MAG: hypothetical protein C4326_09960 [Ignavibacteria bacterium]